MAFRAAQVSVSSTAVQLMDAVAGDVGAWFEVATGTGGNAVYLGAGSSVTTGNGFRLENTDNILDVRVGPGDELWGISSDNFPVHVLIRSA